MNQTSSETSVLYLLWKGFDWSLPPSKFTLTYFLCLQTLMFHSPQDMKTFCPMTGKPLKVKVTIPNSLWTCSSPLKSFFLKIFSQQDLISVTFTPIADRDHKTATIVKQVGTPDRRVFCTWLSWISVLDHYITLCKTLYKSVICWHALNGCQEMSISQCLVCVVVSCSTGSLHVSSDSWCLGQFSALCCPQTHVCCHGNHLALFGMWIGGDSLE